MRRYTNSLSPDELLRVLKADQAAAKAVENAIKEVF